MLFLEADMELANANRTFCKVPRLCHLGYCGFGSLSLTSFLIDDELLTQISKLFFCKKYTQV